MVTGLDTFRTYFQNYSKDYVVIGGVACELALDSLRLVFRPTDDFDIVIVSERIAQGFGAALKHLFGMAIIPFNIGKAMTNQRFSVFSIPKILLSHRNWNLQPSSLLMTGNGILRH